MRRVSIPFIAGQWSLPALEPERAKRLESFNPLHCGAVVASHLPRTRLDSLFGVSIPFIAGQWSLHDPDLQGVRLSLVSIPFIAGQWSLRAPRARMPTNIRVSIPFIAGQWSLPAPPAEARARAEAVSIPFIAGQWSLPPSPYDAAAAALRFNPLHCGAVVASLGQDIAEERVNMFQSPSLRGSGRFKRLGNQLEALARKFQSPSLRGSGRFASKEENMNNNDDAFQSPSLRGSGRFAPPATFVAGGDLFQSPSLRGSGRFSPSPEPRSRRPSSFNPLHCGAVVASRRLHRGRGLAALVSIPFIAGQWSLHEQMSIISHPFLLFQSPSLRGSGRFDWAHRLVRRRR